MERTNPATFVANTFSLQMLADLNSDVEVRQITKSILQKISNTMTKLNVETNPRTGGKCCTFQKGSDWYWADRSYVPGIGIETMIFPCNEKGDVTDWDEVFADRSGASIESCILDFLKRK